MRRVREVLPAALQNDEVLRIARAQTAIRRWPEVVGRMLAERSWPDRFGRGTLWVAVEGSAWAQELRMMKDRILRNLNAVSGEAALFQDVRFGVRPLPERLGLPEESEPPAAKCSVEELSIREIADRRLAKWKHEGGD